MKILLINPNMRTAYNPLPFPPLSLMSIAAVVQHSYEITIHDRNLYKDAEGKTIAAVLDRLKPDLVGVTSLTGPAILDGVMVSRLAKERGAQVVWGGTHASLLPEQTLQNPYIDFVVMNEGEETFRELIEAIELHRGYNNILGLAYKENGEIKLNPERPFIQDLDALPMPAWNLVCRLLLEKKNNNEREYTVTITSIGCLFRCTLFSALAFERWTLRSM